MAVRREDVSQYRVSQQVDELAGELRSGAGAAHRRLDVGRALVLRQVRQVLQDAMNEDAALHPRPVAARRLWRLPVPVGALLQFAPDP